MELLRKSGQLSNVVIFKAPRQIGGDNSHATNPGKPAGSHFIETKNRDSMPSADRGKEGGKASIGKPKGGSTKWYVTEEVNPIDKTPLSEKGSRFVNTKKSCSSAGLRGCRTLIFILCKDIESRKTFIRGKNKAKGRLWKLIIVAEEPEDITAVVMRRTKNFLHNVAKQMH